MLRSTNQTRSFFTRKWSSRSIAFGGAAVAAGLALYSAGVPEFRWPWSAEDVVVPASVDVAPGEAQPIGPGTPSPVLPEIPTGTDSSISATPQPLVLSGTMPGRNFREGTAFIGINRESPQTYAAGALLANGARLIEIYRDHVVLKKGDLSADLYLQDAQPKNARRGPELSALLQIGGPQPTVALVPPSTDILTDYLRPSPIYEGELIKGYQVYPGKRAGVFSQMGLKGGDLIVALNDAPFAGPEEAIDLLRQLSAGTAMVATIRREGKTQRVSLDGRLIVADQEMQKSVVASGPPLPMGPPPI